MYCRFRGAVQSWWPPCVPLLFKNSGHTQSPAGEFCGKERIKLILAYPMASSIPHPLSVNFHTHTKTPGSGFHSSILEARNSLLHSITYDS
jgi:hypothetical protein